MSASLSTLLTRPRRFFAAFSAQSYSWSMAETGYWTFAFIRVVTKAAEQGPSLDPLVIVIGALLVSILWIFVDLLMYGIIWIYVGSKILGGKASFRSSVLAVGYAFLFPGILNLITFPIMMLPMLGETPLIGRQAAAWIVVPIKLLASVWALTNTVLAASQLNGFGKWKIAGLVAWLPLGCGTFWLSLGLLFRGGAELAQRLMGPV